MPLRPGRVKGFRSQAGRMRAGGSVAGKYLQKLVGATGFEPATPCAQGRCATRLRYAPTLKILNTTAVSRSSPFAIFAFLAKTVPKLSQNPIHGPTIPDSSADLSQNARGLVGGPIELLQRLALHLQLHLRVLLEHLRI